MSRLLASGCSFTDYCWSTWADYLGTAFDQYQNVGIAGGDNASVARSIISNARPNDTVVILWSGYDRWSRYQEQPHTRNINDKFDPHWYYTGSLRDQKVYMVNYYHPVERFQTTVDYINLIDCHSYKNQYQAYHFSAFPFLLGEIEKTIDTRLVDIYKKYQFANDYLTETSMWEYMVENNQDMLTTHQYHPAGTDNHPTPLTHYEYVTRIIAPKLNIVLDTELHDIMLKEKHQLTTNHVAGKLLW